MICIDWDTEITGKPVCRAARSAVRWRVPVSSEGIDWSGIRWTAARMIRVTSLSMMIAPSILASSRSPVEVNGTSSVKPPVQMLSTVLSWPSTISAPVRPRRIRSRPSRSAVPGAIEARVARRRSCLLGADRTATASSCGGGTGSSGRRVDVSRRRSGPAGRAVADHPEQRATRSRDVGHLDHAHPLDPALGAGAGAAARHDRDLEPQPGGLRDPLRAGRGPCAARRQPELAHRDHAARGRRPVEAEASATAIARSVAGSTSRAPPTVEANTSCWWSRAAVLVLHQHCGVRLHQQDVFTSTVGGARLVEPATDLAIAVALASASSGRPAPRGVVAMGELGLAGELRKVRDLPQRIAEAARLGFQVAVVPGRGQDSGGERRVEGMRVIEVSDVRSALRLLSLVGDRAD